MGLKRLARAFVLSLLLFLPGLGFAVAPSAGATDVFPVCSTVQGAGGTDVCRERTGSATNPITNVLKIATLIIAMIVGVASVFIIIISALKMISANGNPQQIASARSSIIYALIGLIIAALAGTIVGFVLTRV